MKTARRVADYIAGMTDRFALEEHGRIVRAIIIMNVFSLLKERIVDVIDGASGDGLIPKGLNTDAVTVEAPRNPAHGHVANNAPMVLSNQAGMKPRDLADISGPASQGPG